MRLKGKESLAAAREAREAQIRGAAGGGGGRAVENNGNRGRRRQNSVESTMYDSSDSYENHVIDLRGSPSRGSGMDEGESPVRAVQSEGEGSLENGSARADSELGQRLSNGNNGRSPKYQYVYRRHATPEAEEDEYEEPVQPREHDFIPGQLVWAKFARFPWWPAQVIDPSEVQEGTGGKRNSDTDLLVRFFGTYDYGWVDPFTNLSDFDVKLTERSKIRKKALQKGVEEALKWRSSGTFPEKWELTTKSVKQKKTSNVQSNGAKPSAAKVKGKATEPEAKVKRAPRKRKPKVLFEDEGAVQRKPQRIPRRMRIMRQLGLAAPTGSPFTPEYVRT
ncbi:hypothetical protein R1sor_010880 [Riccia sorocarpa]|uniref:PWWP domain-containing protein n=1 Tax=Riccia sorocarpa TaxID=122646 RepID=A0ABD3I162_9MARC